MTKKAGSTEINLCLTMEETNTILEGLGKLPFMKVYRIIEKIHIQASANPPGKALIAGKKTAKKKAVKKK